MFEIGRVCMKIAGREAGRYCVVIKKMDENFVMVTGPRELTSVKRRRCNINHLEPMLDMLKIKSDAPDSDVLKAYQQTSLTKKLAIEPRRPGKPRDKKEKPKEAVKTEAKKEKSKKAPAKKAEKKAKPNVAGKAEAKKVAKKKSPSKKKK